jgi:hypothetical protein
MLSAATRFWPGMSNAMSASRTDAIDDFAAPIAGFASVRIE